MPTAPYGLRLLVGVAVIALEETRRLPQTILMYPITMASTVAQLVMKVQQDLAGLAIKGDAALESIFPPKDEQPAWATFDEDSAGADAPGPAGERRTEGRFALYSVTDGLDGRGAERTVRSAESDNAEPAEPAARAASEPPAVAVELDYDSLTLAQLRARMTSLSVTELRTLLGYEETGRARAPFQTLLANRITRATAK